MDRAADMQLSPVHLLLYSAVVTGRVLYTSAQSLRIVAKCTNNGTAWYLQRNDHSPAGHELATLGTKNIMSSQASHALLNHWSCFRVKLYTKVFIVMAMVVILEHLLNFILG